MGILRFGWMYIYGLKLKYIGGIFAPGDGHLQKIEKLVFSVMQEKIIYFF